MTSFRLAALGAAAGVVLILSAGCNGPTSLTEFLGPELTGLLTDQLSGASSQTGPSVDDNGGDRPAGVSDDAPGDDNGDDRGDGVSDDPPGDDNGGQRPDGVSDDPPGDDNGGAATDLGGNGGATRISADLSGMTAAKGHAEYRNEGGREKFTLEVEHFPAGSFAVYVNDVMVAEITVGATGLAGIEFDSKAEVGHVPFPAEFPNTIVTGDVVNVGDLVEGSFD